MNIRGVMFDLDGTLTTSLDAFEAAETDAFREFGIHLTCEDFIRMSRIGVRHCMEEFYARVDPALRDHLSASRRTHALKRLRNQTMLFEDVAGCTDFLREISIPHGIVTSARSVHIDAMHVRTRIRDLLAVLADGDAVDPFMKPHPFGLEIGCRQLQIAPDECLYVGDTQFDMEAAARLSMPSCLVIRPDACPRKTADAQEWATYTIDSLDELPRIIRQ